MYNIHFAMQISKFEMQINILSFSRIFSLHAHRILYENTVFQGMGAIRIRRKAADKMKLKRKKEKNIAGKCSCNIVRKISQNKK